MNAYPTSLQMVSESCLQISWSDGQVRQYEVTQLREQCPCASCREKRKAPPPDPTSLTVIPLAETEPLRISRMEPAGRYAYAIHFSDGHDTGLFTLEVLRELGREVSND